MSRHFPLRRFVWIVATGVLFGSVYGGIEYGAPILSAVTGAQISASLFGLELFVLRRNRGGVIRPLPFLQYFALRSFLYAAVISAIIALPPRPPTSLAGVDFLLSLSLIIVVVLFFSLNDLLGPGVLLTFAAGRYYEPRLEERALLFIDMRSSTAIAERLGELRFLKYLNRFIDDLSVAIDEYGGEIHKYVGDEIIAAWRLGPARDKAACIRACFAALSRLKERLPAYELEFGVAADFRAGLHCGQVAVCEVGSLKREIALIGDTMNTAKRIQEACHQTNHRVLASETLLNRLGALPPGVRSHSLGEFAVRGKARPLTLYALEPSDGVIGGEASIGPTRDLSETSDLEPRLGRAS